MWLQLSLLLITLEMTFRKGQGAMRKFMFLAATMLAVIPLTNQINAASNTWFNLHNRPGVFLEFHRADLNLTNAYLDDDRGGWALFAATNVRMPHNVHFVAEIPLVSASPVPVYYVSESGFETRQSHKYAVGSPFLGFTWSRPGNSWIAEAGIMLPVIRGTDSRPINQIRAMFCDKTEAFDPKSMSVEVGAGYHDVGWDGFVFRSMAKFVLHSNFYLDTQLDLAREFRKAFFQVSYVARLRVISEGGAHPLGVAESESYDGNSISERFSSQLMFAAGPRFDDFEAGVSVLFPLDEFYPYAPNMVLGLNLRYFFEPMPTPESGLE